MEIDLVEIDKNMHVIQYQERVSASKDSEDLSWRSNEGTYTSLVREMMHDIHYIVKSND
jgi:hypothetical protein